MIRIGTSGFQYPEWKGTFYPADLPTAKMLPFYGEHFPTTESNYTFRQMPKPATLRRWAELTPTDFRFSLKAPQRITHFAKLRDCADSVRYFCETARELGPKLGTILFQLPPSFAKDLALLETFLRDLPSANRAAFEFRHPSWFDPETASVLRNANAALCIAESDDLVTPLTSTADHGYLRLRKPNYTDDELERWTEQIIAQSQWTDTFIYFKHEESGTGPAFADRLTSALRRRGLA